MFGLRVRDVNFISLRAKEEHMRNSRIHPAEAFPIPSRSCPPAEETMTTPRYLLIYKMHLSHLILAFLTTSPSPWLLVSSGSRNGVRLVL